MLCNKQEFQLLDLADAGAEASLLFLAPEALLCCFTKHFLHVVSPYQISQWNMYKTILISGSQ